jgi:hypothetical protein
MVFPTNNLITLGKEPAKPIDLPIPYFEIENKPYPTSPTPISKLLFVYFFILVQGT